MHFYCLQEDYGTISLQWKPVLQFVLGFGILHLWSWNRNISKHFKKISQIVETFRPSGQTVQNVVKWHWLLASYDVAIICSEAVVHRCYAK